MSDPELLDLLSDVAELLEDHSDVVDGDYGEPRPNRAMRMRQRVDEAIAALEARR